MTFNLSKRFSKEMSQYDNQSLLNAPQLPKDDLEHNLAPQKVSVKEIHAKYSTKQELYKFLAARNNVYLPHHKHLTIWFLRDVLSGKKKR